MLMEKDREPYRVHPTTFFIHLKEINPLLEVSDAFLWLWAAQLLSLGQMPVFKQLKCTEMNPIHGQNLE